MVVFVLFISFFLGLHGTNNQTITRDEQTTLGHIGGLSKHYMSYGDTLDSLMEYSTQHPPLYYFLTNTWGNVFGFSHHIPTMMSVFFAVLTLAVVYRIATDIAGYTAGLYSILLMATSIVFIHYSHEMRPYAVLLFHNSLFLFLYLRLSKRKKKIPLLYLISMTIITICAIYTHVSSIFLFVVVGLYHLFFVRKTIAWWQLSISIAVAGLFFLPWLTVVMSGLDDLYNRLDGNPDKFIPNQDLLWLIPKFWGNGHQILFFFLIVLGAISAYWNRNGARKLFFFCVTIALAILAFNATLEFIIKIRYAFITLIPFVIFGAMGLKLLQHWQTGLLLFFIVWVSVGTNFQANTEFQVHTGMRDHHLFLQYDKLTPLVNSTLMDEDLLILVIRDFRSIKQSKHKLKSIDQYYEDSWRAETAHIHESPEIGNFNLQKLLDRIEGRDGFWITYQYDTTIEQFEFIRNVYPTYQLCKNISYGTLSYLQYFLLADDTNFATRCDTEN